MSPTKTTKNTASHTSTATKNSKGFSAEEKAAMKNRAAELKAEARAGQDRAAGEKAAVEAIAAMKEPDRAIAKRLHALIKAAAPELAPKTWYGFPAYAKDGKVVCFFQPAQKFNTRYSTLGFNDTAMLDDGVMWPVAFALKSLTAAEETKITALIKKAVA